MREGPEREPAQLTLSFAIGRPVRGANALVTRDDGNTVLPTTDADWDEWVSAGAIRNWARNDALLDWLDRYGGERGLARDDQRSSYDERFDFQRFLAGQGNRFEERVLADLERRVGLTRIDVESRDARSLAAAHATVAAMGPDARGDSQSVNEVLGPTASGPAGAACLTLGQCRLAPCFKADSPGAVGQAWFACGVDRGEQDSSQQADVLEEVDSLLCARSRVLDGPEGMGRVGGRNERGSQGQRGESGELAQAQHRAGQEHRGTVGPHHHLGVVRDVKSRGQRLDQRRCRLGRLGRVAQRVKTTRHVDGGHHRSGNPADHCHLSSPWCRSCDFLPYLFDAVRAYLRWGHVRSIRVQLAP